VLLVPLAELFTDAFDQLFATLVANRRGGKVGVHAAAVPVALDRLGMQLDREVVLFCGAEHQEAAEPQVVASLLGAFAEQLEFPLTLHHFGVDTGDREARIQTRIKMFFNEIATDAVLDAHRAIVRALRTGVTIDGEAEWAAVLHDGVFLLEAEPQVGIVFEAAATIGGVDRTIGIQHFAHDQRSIFAAWIFDQANGLEQAVAAVAFGLLRAGSVKGPTRAIVDLLRLASDDLGLATNAGFGLVTVQPNVL